MARFGICVCALGLLAVAVAMPASNDVDDARGFDAATALDAFKKIYYECVKEASFSCVKPKVLAFLSAASKRDTFQITRDLAIERTATLYPSEDQDPQDVLTPMEDFAETHSLRMRLPRELAPLMPANIPREILLPLSAAPSPQGRGFLKKVVVPFLLGLKFKATALLPLALALIALKTWKALTLGLLSLVLSGALVIFKFTKPKVVNYEVFHYPHGGSDHHGYGRGLDLAYSAYAPEQ